MFFEITERTPIRAHNVFKKTLKHYTDQEYKVAIDDFGSEYAGLNRLCYIKPGYLKLDIGLIHGIAKDDVKQALVKHVIRFCKETSTVWKFKGQVRLSVYAELNVQ